MNSALTKRLQALEARPPKVDTEHSRKFAAAVSALFDAVSTRGNWKKSTVAPFDLEAQPSEMDLLWSRIEAGATTDDDRAMLDGLPNTHVTPEKLVECVMKVRGKY
jgi:hypothetical protein